MELKTEFLLILDHAENLYGPRDTNLIIDEVKIVDAKNSPMTILGKNSLVNVNLSKSISVNLNKVFEMSHEAMHCLNPCKREQCSYLEEAVAVHFSLKYVCYDSSYRDLFEDTQHRKYKEALEALENISGSTDEIIKKLRLGCRSLSDLTLSDFTLAGLGNADNKNIIKLLTKFY